MIFGIQNIDVRKVVLSIIAISILLLFSLEPSLALGEGVAPHVMRRGTYRLPSGTEVGDVVVSGGPVEIMGKVRGSLFVADGTVTVFEGGEISGNVTVINRELRLLPGSVVHGSVYVIGGRIDRRENAKVEGEISEKKEKLSFESRILLMKYLVFERPCPPPGTPDEILASLSRNIYGWKKDGIIPWNSLTIGELPSIALPAGAASSARIGLWRQWQWEIRVGVARFADGKEAAGFWETVQKIWPEEKMRNSVHVSLGDGAHWFFVNGNHSSALWIGDKCLVLVDAGPGPDAKGSANFAERLRDQTIWKIVHAWTRQGHHR